MYSPKFQITNNLLTYVANIESSKAVIDNSPLIPAWESKFRDEALGRTVHFGTKIEGNDLSEEQAKQVVRLDDHLDSELIAQKAGIVARDRDIQEVINYRNVINWIDQWEITTDKKNRLSIRTLKTLHQLTMQRLLDENNLGNFRKKQVIVKSAVDGSVAFRPPVAVEIPYLVDDFFEWLGSEKILEVHPIFRAAITHYQLVFIHPFIEGNGRTARAMANLVLYESAYDFKRFFSIEEYFDNDVRQYYHALRSVQQNAGDLTFWLEYFCYGLAMEIDKVKRRVAKLSRDLKLKKELGRQVALTERQLILLELLQEQGNITSQDAQRVLPHISVDTILRDLKDLIEKGLINKKGVTKGVSYALV
ncbi:MAG: Fic family protein [Patescibacteria group bacterium]